MDIYNYNKEGLFTGQSKARPNPLEKGKFLIPARATIEKPPAPNKAEEVYFANGWHIRLKKTNPPSKYHVWDDKTGWSISEANQSILDKEIIAAGKTKEKARLLSENEAKIQAEIRKIAVQNLKTKGELPQDYKE